MSKYFTRKGDDGTTGLLGEGRLPKDDARFEALGSLDEASAALGLARSLMDSRDNARNLMQVQRDLYNLMAEVASTPATEERFRTIDEDRVKWLEDQVVEVGGGVKMPDEFILPGDNPAAGALSLARTIVRRAERRLVELNRSGIYRNQQGLAYLNRLSSFCFLLELSEIQAGGGSPSIAKKA